MWSFASSPCLLMQWSISSSCRGAQLCMWYTAVQLYLPQPARWHSQPAHAVLRAAQKNGASASTVCWCARVWDQVRCRHWNALPKTVWFCMKNVWCMKTYNISFLISLWFAAFELSFFFWWTVVHISNAVGDVFIRKGTRSFRRMGSEQWKTLMQNAF